MYIRDTIVAISTPQGRGAIGVVRLSGDDSLHIARRLVKGTLPPVPSRPVVKNLYHPDDGFLIDKALVTYFQSPQSFTGEDVVELSCHGSTAVLSCLVDALLAQGARASEPGEFSFRAYSNHKLDLNQAEAIKDLIDAKSIAAMQQASRQLNGELSVRLSGLKQELLNLIVIFQSAIEFVEDDLSVIENNKISVLLSRLISSVKTMLETYRAGMLLKNGIKVVLVGRPNVGKSSLFNCLSGYERAIVTHIPGTTRDVIDQYVEINGIPVNIVDTAGLRESDDLVESLGIQRTLQAAVDADLLLIVVDAIHSDLTDNELDFIEEKASVPHIIVINKVDINDCLPEYVENLRTQHCVIETSTVTGEGIENLKHALFLKLGVDAKIAQSDVMLTNARQRDLMQCALESLEYAYLSFSGHVGDELVVIGLQNALKCFDDMTGETTPDDVLGQIFSQFCIGK